MKNILLASILFITTFYVTAGEHPTKNEPYQEVAREMCDCVNQSITMLSDRMINILVESDGDEAYMGVELEKYVEEDLEAAMKDVEVLQGTMLDDMTNCFDRVSEDYEDVYTEASDEEIEAGILAAMESMDDCKSSVAFFKLGMTSSHEETDKPVSPERSNPGSGTSGDNYLYEEVSIQICDCISGATVQLSPRMIEVFLQSNGDPELFEDLISMYADEDPEGAMRDADLLQGDVANNVTSCMDRIESDYDDVFESTSEEEIEKNMIATLDRLEGCELSTIIMKLGLSE